MAVTGKTASPSPFAFNNSFLISAAGEIDHDFIAFSARARAIAASETGTAEPHEIRIWEEKLTGMADMLRTRFARNALQRAASREGVMAEHTPTPWTDGSYRAAAAQEGGDWDDGCFYRAGKSALELQRPIQRARATLVKGAA
jgi:hypothetical protein